MTCGSYLVTSECTTRSIKGEGRWGGATVLSQKKGHSRFLPYKVLLRGNTRDKCVCVWTYMHLTKINGKRGHKFWREQRKEYGEVWREEREKRNFVTILQSQKLKKRNRKFNKRKWYERLWKKVGEERKDVIYYNLKIKRRKRSLAETGKQMTSQVVKRLREVWARLHIIVTNFLGKEGRLVQYQFYGQQPCISKQGHTGQKEEKRLKSRPHDTFQECILGAYDPHIRPHLV